MLEKSAKLKSAEVGDDIMREINQYTLENLTAEDVFVFKVIMCDNEVDRDCEYFTVDALEKLGKFFMGRTVIEDHQRKVGNQNARIFRTEINELLSKNFMGDPYTQLIAYCYMLRSEKNADTIAEIKAGIRKEVSVGFMIESLVCSICGADNMTTYCPHWPGKEYDGATCYFEMKNPTDAYELSFVAIPAQPAAAVIKEFKDKNQPKEPKEPVKKESKNIESANNRIADLAFFVRLKNFESEE